MTNKAPVQSTLRRVYFLQQPRYLRAMICALLWYNRFKQQSKVAEYLNVSDALVSDLINAWTNMQYDQEDYLTGQELIENMDGPLFATHW